MNFISNCFCLIRRILLFVLPQRVNRKVKAAFASLGKTTCSRLKFLNSSFLLKQQEFFNAAITCFPAHRTRPKPEIILLLLWALHHWIGLFLSIPESKQNLSEKEKFRVSEEITSSKLGFVKMMGEDKKQPWTFCFVFASRQRWRPPAGIFCILEETKYRYNL